MTEELKTIDTVDTSPFKKMVITIGELPTSFVDSMTYYELLAWLCHYLEKTVIPAVNNNAEVSAELQAKFIELKSYVDNYFDNLDVQEEINNKLDDMAEAGTLQEIITTYIQSNVAWTFDTVTDMQSSTNLVSGSYAQTLGFHSVNDGGGALYYIDTNGTVNGMDIIEIDSTLKAHLVYGNELNVKQFGAYGDNTHNDTIILQYVIDKAYETKIKVINIPEGIYLISQPLEIYENKNYDMNFDYSNSNYASIGYPISKLIIKGENQYNTMLKVTTGDYVFNCYATTPVAIQDLRFENIYFNGNDVAHSCIQMDIVHFGGHDIEFENCSFNSFTECGIKHEVNQSKINTAPLRNNVRLHVTNCRFSNNKNGLMVGGDDTIINQCIISQNKEFGLIIYGLANNFNVNNCKIQYNGQDKTGYNGGQILFQALGKTYNIQNSYLENKSSTLGSNDTGVIYFDLYPNTSGNQNIYNINISDCYMNIMGAPTVIEVINTIYINDIKFENNGVNNLYSDKPYIITKIPSLESNNILVQKITSSGNSMRPKSADGTTNITYYYLLNGTGYSEGGDKKFEFGAWSPLTTNNLANQMPTLIAGSISSSNSLAMRKIGDYTNTKNGTGNFVITFDRPIDEPNTAYKDNYPVFATLTNPQPFEDIKVIDKSNTGFTVVTGDWNSDFTTFTPSNKSFDFIALFLSKA